MTAKKPAPTLRDRLAAKARRQTTIQVPVEDTTAAEAAVHEARAEWLAAAADGADQEAAEQAYKDAIAAFEALHADIALQAMAPGDFEALVDAHTDTGGEIDRTAFLPVALAASAVDESLRDEDWWAAQLAEPKWTDGERALLFRAVHALNDPATRVSAVPKG